MSADSPGEVFTSPSAPGWAGASVALASMPAWTGTQGSAALTISPHDRRAPYSSSDASQAARRASASASARRSGFRTMRMKKYACQPMNRAQERKKKTTSVLEKVVASTAAT